MALESDLKNNENLRLFRIGSKLLKHSIFYLCYTYYYIIVYVRKIKECLVEIEERNPKDFQHKEYDHLLELLTLLILRQFLSYRDRETLHLNRPIHSTNNLEASINLEIEQKPVL